MHKPRFLVFPLFALSLLLLPACGASAQDLTAGSSARPQNVGAPTGGGGAAPAAAQPAGEQKVFRGTVGAYPARMTLRRAPGGELTGSYSYEGRAGSLALKGKAEAKGKFTLDEFDGERQTGRFKGDWDEKDYAPEASLYGDWTKPGGGGEQSFFFTEQRQTPGGPSATTKQVREENKRRGYTVSAEYPQFEGAVGFNRLAQDFVTKEVAEFKKGAGRAPGDKDYSPGAGEDSLNVAYRVRLATPELVSVEFPIDYYAHGAAHPSHAFHVINYEQKSGRELALADLFKPGSDYLKKISEVAVAQVRRWNKDSAEYSGADQPYLDDEGIREGAAPKAENYQNWTLTPRGLVVTFDYYQLGSYAAGAQTVVIPYAELKDVLRADGPLAPLLK